VPWQIHTNYSLLPISDIAPCTTARSGGAGLDRCRCPTRAGRFQRAGPRPEQPYWRVGKGDQMTVPLEQINSLLHEAGETHHRVFRIVDGADDDWASWYADWLINLSELPALLGVKPVRSELTYLLVSLDKEYTTTQPGEPWETYYAQRILSHFSPQGR
jgi:hypothetical protein